MLELTGCTIELLKEAAAKLTGSVRRMFIARVVGLGELSQRRAHRLLGWHRGTIRKGTRELATGVAIADGRRNNGPKTLEEGLPNLRSDLDDIVKEYSQADPTFRTTQMYRRLTVAEVRRRLAEKGYGEDVLPSEESIRVRLNDMGYRPLRVRKTVPKKKGRRPTRSSSASSP